LLDSSGKFQTTNKKIESTQSEEKKFEKTISNYLRGRNIRWGVFRGARGGGFGVGRFKRGAELEHNHFGNIRMVPKQQVDRKNKLGVFYGLKNYFLNSSHVFFFFSCFV
jgi:hypothetical protein